MSRLRMSVEGLGAEDEVEDGNGAAEGAEAGPAVVRPSPMHEAINSTLDAPPSSGVQGGVRPASADPVLHFIAPGVSSWQPPRHASIHQHAGQLRSYSRDGRRGGAASRTPDPYAESPSYEGSTLPQSRRSPSSLLSESVGGPQPGHMFKVLVVGNAGVGKTSLIKRYAHDVFSDQYQSTIGVDFALKILKVASTKNGGPDEIVRLQLWDIAGQEQFGAMTRVYYKGAVGAFVVFDLTDADDGGESVRGWKHDIDEKVRMPNGEYIPVVLLGNKCDLAERREWPRKEVDSLCEVNGFKHWFEVSAKAKVNVTEAHSFLVTLMLKAEAAREMGDDQSVFTMASVDELAPTTGSPGKIILERNPQLSIEDSCCT
mmetsp:Transcript_30671/g.91930  ORF Transcript_30671/g.91930 Transcript_30671/m.91930 type:complete len:372 (+) Transcript_30671:191-1306(+)